MKKVFLGGTTPSSDPIYGWRGDLIPKLRIDYFNPVVPDWTEDCIAEEYRQKRTCTHELYTITPEMKGCFSIAECVDCSNKNPKGTIFCLLKETDKGEFSEGDYRSLDAMGKMVELNGGKYFKSLDEVAKYLNGGE